MATPDIVGSPQGLDIWRELDAPYILTPPEAEAISEEAQRSRIMGALSNGQLLTALMAEEVSTRLNEWHVSTGPAFTPIRAIGIVLGVRAGQRKLDVTHHDAAGYMFTGYEIDQVRRTRAAASRPVRWKREQPFGELLLKVMEKPEDFSITRMEEPEDYIGFSMAARDISLESGARA